MPRPLPLLSLSPSSPAFSLICLTRLNTPRCRYQLPTSLPYSSPRLTLCLHLYLSPGAASTAFTTSLPRSSQYPSLRPSSSGITSLSPIFLHLSPRLHTTAPDADSSPLTSLPRPSLRSSPFNFPSLSPPSPSSSLPCPPFSALDHFPLRGVRL